MVEGTRLESVEEIRRALGSPQRTQTVNESLNKVGQQDATLPFRPTRRPPMAVLCILDDGSREEGEWVRLRGATTVLGRSDGDVQISHDAAMSSRHAELTRQLENGRYRWYLTDLHSTNGTYVRVSAAILKHGQELLIGSRRYRFEAAGVTTPVVETVDPGEGSAPKTRGWESVAPTTLLPALVELNPHGEGQRFLLTRPENWVGRDPGQCSVVPPDDVLVSPRHAKVYRDARGHWHVQNGDAMNGTWLRVDKIPLDGACQFQLGEQRFLIRIP